MRNRALQKLVPPASKEKREAARAQWKASKDRLVLNVWKDANGEWHAVVDGLWGGITYTEQKTHVHEHLEDDDFTDVVKLHIWEDSIYGKNRYIRFKVEREVEHG
jgi:hypothetical protein